MKNTYEESMTRVFEDEGGYTNDKADPGGPTNFGITIADARMYWKTNATADDVKKMPKAVASDIYAKHYASPIKYDTLPAGVDYAVLDYAINSGVSRALRVLSAAQLTHKNSIEIINYIYDERLAFFKRLKTWPTFGRGWEKRCISGRKLALSMAQRTVTTAKSTTPVHTTWFATLTGSALAAAQWGQTHPIYVGVGIISAALITWFIFRKKV